MCWVVTIHRYLMSQEVSCPTLVRGSHFKKQSVLTSTISGQDEYDLITASETAYDKISYFSTSETNYVLRRIIIGASNEYDPTTASSTTYDRIFNFTWRPPVPEVMEGAPGTIYVTHCITIRCSNCVGIDVTLCLFRYEEVEYPYPCDISKSSYHLPRIERVIVIYSQLTRFKMTFNSRSSNIDLDSARHS